MAPARRLIACLAAVLIGGIAAASPVTTAIFERDVVRLEQIRDHPDATEEVALARGAALALRHQDAASLAILTPLSRMATERSIRSGACYALADVALRQGRYRDAYTALQCVEEMSGSPLSGEPKQIRDDAAALANEPAMQSLKPAYGTLSARRDRAGLIRVPVTINGQALQAAIDTDASFSAVSESVARWLGLRILPPRLSILTTARPDQPMRLALAEELRFGGAVFHHVVFAVLPDKAVRFGGGYQMEAVLGLPVLVGLGRLEYNPANAKLTYGRYAAAAAGPPNMALSGLDPFVLVRENQSGAILRLALDSAADTTILNAKALSDFPALGQTSGASRVSQRGIGGMAYDAHARSLPELRFAIGASEVGLKRIKIISTGDRDRHGQLGFDSWAHAKVWGVDFDAMFFWIEP